MRDGGVGEGSDDERVSVCLQRGVIRVESRE